MKRLLLAVLVLASMGCHRQTPAPSASTKPAKPVRDEIQRIEIPVRVEQSGPLYIVTAPTLNNLVGTGNSQRDAVVALQAEIDAQYGLHGKMNWTVK